MWELVTYSPDEGGHKQLGEFSSLDECKKKKAELNEGYILYSGELNDTEQISKIIKIVESENSDNEAAPKLIFNDGGLPMTSNCWCFQDVNGNRVRECLYCNDKGYCWITRHGPC